MGKNKDWTIEELEFMNNNYPSNGTLYCSTRLGRSITSTKYAVNKLKLMLNWGIRAKIQIDAKSKKFEDYSVNPTPFLNINTPEVAYMLGLLWADGHVQYSSHLGCVELGTTYPDSDVFVPIFLDYGKWSVTTHKPKNSKHKLRYRILTSNRPLATFLFKCDYTSKSKSPDKILSKIPDELKYYWFRGLVDGDGHVNKDRYQITISSSYEQDWSYMINLCNQLNITYKIKQNEFKQGTKNSVFMTTGKSAAIRLGSYIYNNREIDKLGLDRKYAAYLNFHEMELRNRFKGVWFDKYNDTWRSITSRNDGNCTKRIGSFKYKKDAINAVKQYYNSDTWPIPLETIKNNRNNKKII